MGLSKDKKVWFIRHGESEANAGLSTSEPGMIALTEKGYKQAQDFASLINQKPDLIITSKFIRTQQTAEATLEKFPNTLQNILDLHEFDFLSQKLCMNTTVEDRKPMVYEYWKSCEAKIAHGDDSEAFKDFYDRVILSLNKIEELEHNFILVFAHGHVMRAIWQCFITGNDVANNACMKYFRDKMTMLPVPNCSTFKVNYINGNWNIESPIFLPDDYPYRD